MLADKILSAKSGNKDDMLCLIEKFSPVIKKYGRKLDIEEGISEVTLYFIELVHHLNIHKLRSCSDAALVCYVAQCISHFYTKMKKGPYLHLRGQLGLRSTGGWRPWPVPAEDPCPQSQAGQKVQGVLS